MWKYSISWPVRRGVEVASGADGQPARAADVSGMHDAGAHPILVARQVLLDGQLVDAVLPVGVLGRILGGADDGATPVRPDAAGMNDV